MNIEMASEYQGISDSETMSGMQHYVCTIKCDNRRASFHYYMGTAHKNPPELEDVLYSLAMESAPFRESTPSFEDWADELGYDTDSRKAERIFRECGGNAANFFLLLGDHVDEVLKQAQAA